MSQFAWIAITNCYRLVLINSRNLFITVLESGNPKSRRQHVLLQALFWVKYFFFETSHSRKGQGSSVKSLI